MHVSHNTFIPIFALFIACSSLLADNTNTGFSGAVSSITIENTGGIPVSRINKIIGDQRGTEYSEGTVAEHIRQLMESDLLYDVLVSASSDGTSVGLSYSCIPLPMLNSITAEAGNSNKTKRLPPRLIEQLFSLKHGDPFNTAQFKADIEDIENLYHAEHFHNMRLSAQGKYDAFSNTVDMAVFIERGKKTFAYDIIIQGNYSIDTDVIASHLHCAERNFLLFEPGYYDPRQFSSDAKAIQTYYREEGYLDAEVTVEGVQGTKPSRIYILVRITEGPLYTLGSVNWKQRVLTSNQFARLTSKLDFEAGEIYYESLPYTAREIIKEYCLAESGAEPIVDIATYMNAHSSPTNPVVDMSILIRKSRNGYKDPYRIPAKYDQPFSLKTQKK